MPIGHFSVSKRFHSERIKEINDIIHFRYKLKWKCEVKKWSFSVNCSEQSMPKFLVILRISLLSIIKNAKTFQYNAWYDVYCTVHESQKIYHMRMKIIRSHKKPSKIVFYHFIGKTFYFFFSLPRNVFFKEIGLVKNI